MRFSYDWIADYLDDAPSKEDMVRLLNETGLESEVDGPLLEIEHTVNRPDAMNHFGLAREIAVKLGVQPIQPPQFEGELPNPGDWAISSDDHELCWRYMLLEVANVQAVASPAWLVEKLEAIGQTCHNLLVDLTNFLLWEYGHPSHAFDSQKLHGRCIHVRKGLSDETMTTLDGKDHKVANHLCITDKKGPVALAGIMGGQNSEVDTQTTTIALELAVFQPKGVRISGRALGIESDARHRFERGVDQESMERVIRRFIHLLTQAQPEAQLLSFTDMNHRPFKRRILELRQSRLQKILGIQLPSEKVLSLLTSMDFQPESNENGWTVHVPGYKVDVEREIDVIEEIIRFAGLNLLNSTLPAMTGTSFEERSLASGSEQIHSLLTSMGFMETCTYSFLPSRLEERFGEGSDPIALRNPMTENQAVLRRSMLPNLLECARRNHNHGNSLVAFYEIGKVFHAHEERTHFSAVFSEVTERADWWGTPNVHPFYRLKGVLEALVSVLDWEAMKLEELQQADSRFDLGLGIFNQNQQVGLLGVLSSKEAAFWDFNHPVAVMEMDLEFLDQLNQQVRLVEALSEFPGMKIDMAFVVDQSLAFEKLKTHIVKLQPAYLQELSLFDVYQGKGIPKDKKSLGLRFRFQNKDRTLTSEEVSGTMTNVVASVKSAFGAEIRE